MTRFPTAFLVLAMLAALLPGSPAIAAGEVAMGPVSGLPMPRFVSLKSDRVNVRGGPTKENDVSYIYMRTGLPMEITAEFENWRRIRDSEGAEGWVYHSMLSGRRTVVVNARSKDDLVPLHATATTESDVSAKLQTGVVAQVRRCDGEWCRIVGERFDGYVRQERLWGVYPSERIN